MFLRSLLLPLLCIGCKSDQELQEVKWEEIALISGDFDNMGESLIRMGIDYIEYSGFISQATYNPEIDPDSNVLQVENILQGIDDEGKPIMNGYDALFINSGTRGLGQYQYNGTDLDDSFVIDPIVSENLYAFTAKGKSVVLSDWAGDLVESAWPDAIQFVNEDNCDQEHCWDAAQMGTSETVIARVVDEELQGKLGADTVSLQFDFSYWSVMESVSDDVKVHLRGDVEYRVSSGEGYGTLEDVPLLVSFKADRGLIVFSSFHWATQNSSVSDTILLHVAEGLNPTVDLSGAKEDYEELLAVMPKAIDWSELSEYEDEDNTAGSQTMACSGDTCEIVDLT